VVVRLPGSIVSETTEVWLHFVSFFHFNSHTFDLQQNERLIVTYLVVLHSDFHFEFVRHHELVSFY
jgi:hypothetical protein